MLYCVLTIVQVYGIAATQEIAPAPRRLELLIEHLAQMCRQIDEYQDGLPFN
jgi:hypothetical protein